MSPLDTSNPKKRKSTTSLSRKTKRAKHPQGIAIKKLAMARELKDAGEVENVQDAVQLAEQEIIAEREERLAASTSNKKKKEKFTIDKPERLLKELEKVDNPFAPVEKPDEQVKSKKRKFKKGKALVEAHEVDLDRTVFLGNVPFRPIMENPEKLKKRLTQFLGGSTVVESLRLRNLPVITDVEDAKRHKQNDKLAEFTTKLAKDTKIHLNQFRTRELKTDDDYYEITAYVKLKDKEEVKDFIKKFNRREFEKSILTADEASAKGLMYDEKIQSKTAVLTGIPNIVKTKDLYDAFEEIEGIHSIRVIRDPNTRLARGVAYVHFLKKKLCAKFVSNYREINYMGRLIQIMRFQPDKKVQEQHKLNYKTWKNKNQVKGGAPDDEEAEERGGRGGRGSRGGRGGRGGARGGGRGSKPNISARERQELLMQQPHKFWQGNFSTEKLNKKHQKLWKKMENDVLGSKGGKKKGQ